jgi:hypothetical protein
MFEFRDFEQAYIWSIQADSIERMKDKLPHLYSVYKKCANNEKKITLSLPD